MNKSYARAGIILVLLAAAPVVALDFHGWRTDGIYIQGSSVNQQSSNQANNIHDDLLDPASLSWGLYYMGEKTDNGGTSLDTAQPSPFGDVPPTQPLKDNREQEREVDWATWPMVTGKTLGAYPTPTPARPTFTPNVPQGWSPVEVDLGSTGNGTNAPDHLLAAISLTPPKVGDTTSQDRDQILTLYYPQMQAGVPGNNNAAGSPVAAADQFTVRPLWTRPYLNDPGDADPLLPGLRIRDLDPNPGHAGGSGYSAPANNVANPAVGVVTQAPIFARVPYTSTLNGQTVTEVLPVVYLVVGTGENNDTSGTNGDYAYVYCISLRRPGSQTASVDKTDRKGDWLPATTNLGVQEQLHAPNPWYFDPSLPVDDQKQGCIMWAYKVHARSDAAVPTAAVPVAGISFANVGDTTNSVPLLFLTTKDGQIIALNAKAFDNQPASVDDDPKAGEERWAWKSPDETGMMPVKPQFLYGMAPAVARVGLDNLFGATPTGNAKNTVNNAITKFKVSEWMLFVADTYGNFWGLDAPGHRDTAVTSHWTQKTRDDLGKPNGDERWVARAGAAPLTDAGGVNPERFVVPPLVYQGNTPLQNASGATVNGSVDQGFDDEVIFASEKGSVYAFDAVGQLTVAGGAATDGQPTYATGLRFKLPQDDTAYDFTAAATPWDPATQFYPTAGTPPTDEPRLWPRELRNTGSVLRGKKIDIKNDANAYNGYFCRAPLGVGFGANANPDGATPNLDVGEHAIYIPYLQEQTSKFGANYRAFFEYLGSIKPYGFVQMSQPISQLDTTTGNEPTVSITTATGTTTYKIPQRLLSVGTIKANGVPVNLVPTTPAAINGGVNPFYDPTFQNPGDTVYLTSPSWFDDASSTWVSVPFDNQAAGVTVTFNIHYFPPTSPSNLAPATTSIAETLTYPSCYHSEYTDSTNISKVAYVRGRATLDEAYNRLELRRLQPGTGGSTGVAAANQDEDPAEVSRALWTSTSEPTDTSTPPNPNNPTPNPGLTDAGFRPGGMYASGSAGAGGTVMAPAMFRGRIFAFNDHLQPLRIVHGCFDPRMDATTSTSPGQVFGVPHPNANGGYGPTTAAAPAADQLNQYDPGEFYVYPVDGTGAFDPTGAANLFSAPFLAEEPALTRVGASVTMVDGWMYVIYRNGHMRAYANVGGGAGGTVGGNPPMFQPPNSIAPTAGQVVKAPGIFGGGDATVAGIHIAFQNPVTAGTGGATPTAPSLDPSKYRDMSGPPDSPLLLDWGQTFYVVVDFGPGNLNVDQDPRIDGSDVDQRVIQNDIQAQVRSSNGAVQQLPGVNKGARATQYTVAGATHWAAVIPVFAGIPSATNPLTPGTPLLWERNPNDANANHTFTNELTYDIQVTQQGLQWYWGPPAPSGTDPSTLKPMDPKKTHFWEVEPNQGAVRFPTTGGGGSSAAATWKFHPGGGVLNTNEWAPLVSYNNPFVVRYKPDGPNSNALHGIWANGAPQPNDTIALDENYTDALAPGRKNGDLYITPYVAGAHSGSGTPVVPTVGQAYVGGNAKQITFGDHGKSTTTAGTTFIANGMGGTTPLPLPDQNILYIADRSHMGLIGRSLTVRVQTAPLTKLGVGALIGRASGPNAGALGNLGLPAGSFEQNQLSLDDAPDQLYPSIPQSRISVTKAGTSVDLRQGAAPIPGRVPGRNTNGFFDLANPATLEAQMAGLAVQVDIPLYTADDVYGTRWRTTTGQGASPANAINPFFPNNAGIFTGPLAPQPMWDQAEERSQPNQPTQTSVVPPLGDPLPGTFPATNAQNQGQSDRTRRVVVFNDSNGNGQLDLLPNYREAYRTFEVQVAVKPDMKLQAAQGTVDLGSVWHGKKQPGTGAGALDIREWQAMQASLAGNNTAGQIARFYQQYWRPFNIQNTGNVNLAYIKPELVLRQGSSVGFLALASQGNDPWRALSLINPNLPSALTDPQQLFLRTSFDDQMLPNASQPYGDTTRGVWLQKARMGAGQPASVVYAEGDGVSNNPSGNPQLRDPTAGGQPRPTYMSLNIPTGSALGQFSGQIRFFNDRAVTFNEDFANDAAGFDYRFPATYTGQADGTLERAANGEPLEPITDPPFSIKIKVMENMVHGRYQVASGQQDPPDRRVMPTAAPVINSSGQVLQMLLAYASDRNNPNNPPGVTNQASMYDLYGSKLTIDPSTLLFPFDELPLDRAPWTELTSNNPGWSLFTAPAGVGKLGLGAQISKPSLYQDGAGNMLLSMVLRRTQGAGNNFYDLLFKPVDPANPVGPPGALNPGGQNTDARSAKSGVRLVVANTATGNKLLAFYGANNGPRRNLDMTWANSASPGQWAPELMIPTSSSLSSVNDPHVFTTDQVGRVAPFSAAPGQPAFSLPDNAALPRMAWLAYSGTSTRLGRTDIYLDRLRLDNLVTVAPRGTASQLTADQEFGKVAFPRVVNEVLVANANRTVYTAGGVDWMFRTWGPPAALVGLYRPDLPNVQPIQLVDTANLLQQIRSAPSQITNEISVPLDPAAISAAPGANQNALRGVRVLLDRSAGTVRFTTDARTLASLLTVALPGRMATNAPDPVILADYTPATLRLTRGDVSANDPVIVPMISKPGQNPIMDASWYLQQIDPNKWANNQPVAAEADRMWLFWRRSGGTVSGGPSCFYKVLRPGFRVNAGAIGDISNLNTSAGRPAEVNPQTGTVFFPYSYEGQVVTITYTLPGGTVVQNEPHVVTWADESGERPVPMDTAVNEGSLDAFGSLDQAVMTNFGNTTGQVQAHMDRIWLFWSSTRGSGGDVFYATLAPRLGLDVNVGQTITLGTTDLNPLSALSPGRVAQLQTQAATNARRHPFVLPPVGRRGSFMQGPSGAGARTAGNR